MRGIGRSYPADPPVDAIRNLDLDLAAGSFTAIVGPSGSGKSTLLHIVGILDRPTSGTYRLAGREVTTADEQQRAHLRRTLIGFVFQAFHLLEERSVIENVMLGLLYHQIPKKERQSAASEALERVGLAHRRFASPRTLSGGERQRVAIARALVASPPLLLADEPTGNLDSNNSRSIIELFQEVHDQGQTVVVITHDPWVAAQSQRQVRLADGLVVSP